MRGQAFQVLDRDLDVTTGEALLSAATAAVATGPSRLDIDLRALESFDEKGAPFTEVLSGLSDGATYYLAVRAYDAARGAI